MLRFRNKFMQVVTVALSQHCVTTNRQTLEFLCVTNFILVTQLFRKKQNKLNV